MEPSRTGRAPRLSAAGRRRASADLPAHRIGGVAVVAIRSSMAEQKKKYPFFFCSASPVRIAAPPGHLDLHWQ